MEIKKNERLRRLIQAKFKTQQNFAAALQVQDSEVSKVIAGSRIISPSRMSRYVEVLGVTVKDIFSTGLTA